MKIFKLFVSISLILTISLINSFAAISVSDGSAFVTKAEFAADLNNLSNRMSSLENSLDAKIDSLVSSYLSRNGIWNGEKQTFLDYTEEKIWPNIWCRKGVDDETVYNNPVSICKTSKSGLANFSFSLKGNNGFAAHAGYAATLYKIYLRLTSTSDTAKGVVSFICQIMDKTNSNAVLNEILLSSTVFNTTNHQRFVNGFLASYNANTLFFVNKDRELVMRMVVVNEGGNWSTSWMTRDTSAPYVNPKLKYNYLNIY